jgi:hypothetical protein
VYERRRARILLAALTLVALGFVTVDARAGETNALDRVRDGAGTVFGPLQAALDAALRPVVAVVAEVRSFTGLRSENAELRAELERHRERQRSVEDLLRENENFRQLLEIRSDLVGRSEEFELVAAHVIALAPSNFEWTVTLDVGDVPGDTLAGPNGVFWDEPNGRLLIASIQGKAVFSWRPGDRSPILVATGPGGYDGIDRLSDGRIVIASQDARTTFRPCFGVHTSWI